MKTNWISVKERKPAYEEDVWAWVIFENGAAYGTETWREPSGGRERPTGEDEWALGCARNYRVTHWMPLPDPPESK